MSRDFFQNISLPAGEAATPASITAAVSTALSDLEDRVKAAGRRAVWDTAAISTDVEYIDDNTLDGDRDREALTTVQIEVLTIDPKEVQL